MATKNIRWGIIGCGAVTEVKSGPAYQLVEGFTLQAVMRRNREKARDYAARHKVAKFFDDPDQLINDTDVDAIYIATPPDSHKYYALKVADLRKPCCIEKPLAPSYQDCLEINDAFNQTNTPLFVAYYRRSLPRFNTVKKMLDKGLIGKVRHIDWQLYKPANVIDLKQQYNWRTDPKIAVGGYFDDLASHGLDLFIYLFGDVSNATGIATNQQALYGAYDSICGSWLHQNGVTGAGSWNFGAANRKDRVTVIGDQGELRFSVFDEHPIELEFGDSTESVQVENPKHIQLNHVRNLRDSLLNDSPHPSTGVTAAHTSWVMDKILGKI